MKTICCVIAALAVGYSVKLDGQVVNGDFSAGTNGWNFIFPPSNVYFPSYGLGSIDIDGPGPLAVSQAFTAQVGDTALLNLEQAVNLTAGVTYAFHADLAMVPHAFNADGGTVSAYIGSTLLGSYSFGYVTSLTQVKYGGLSTNYVPSVSGSQTLSLHFTRGYGSDGSTPSDYIDNISLQAPLPPTLQIQSQGGNVVLTWTNAAYGLQTAPTATGFYTNIPSATSPYTNALSGPAGYFRLIGS